MQMIPLYEALLEKTRKFITEDSKDTDTASDEYLSNFSYVYWERSEEVDREVLKPVIELLLSPKYKYITECNLAIANANSDWKDHPIENAIIDYLNDFLNYLIPRIVNLDDWKVGFDKNYEIFEKEYLSDELSVDFWGHLANFCYKFEDTGEFNNHTKIIVLNSFKQDIKHETLCNKRADCFRVKKALTICFPPIDKDKAEKQPYYLYYKKKFKKNNFGTKPSFNIYHLMQKFILGVRLFSRIGKPYCDYITPFFQGRLSPFGHSQAFSFPENQIGTEFSIDMMGHPETTWLKRLWEKLESMDYFDRLVAFDHHLDDSLRRGNRSAKNPYNDALKITDELDRLSDYFSAFDSIYKDTKGNTGKIIATHTARLVTYKRNPQDTRNPNDWIAVKDFMESMYGIRNDYEHGRYGDAIKKAGRFEGFKEQVRTVGWHLREVAILYIMNDSFESQLPKTDQGNCTDLKNIYY